MLTRRPACGDVAQKNKAKIHEKIAMLPKQNRKKYLYQPLSEHLSLSLSLSLLTLCRRWRI